MASAMRPLMRAAVRFAAAQPTRGSRGAKNRGWYYRALSEREEEKKRVALPPYPETPLHGRARRRAYFDVAVGAAAPARLTFELADDIVPKTVSNFLALCAMPASAGGYKGSKFHEIWKGVAMFAGETSGVRPRAAPGAAAPGSLAMADENFIVRHSARGVLSMAGRGVHSGGSVVFVAAQPLPHLDGRNVAFGRVVAGLPVLDDIEKTFAVRARPVADVVIADCGELPGVLPGGGGGKSAGKPAAAAGGGAGKAAAAAPKQPKAAKAE